MLCMYAVLTALNGIMYALHVVYESLSAKFNNKKDRKLVSRRVLNTSKNI